MKLSNTTQRRIIVEELRKLTSHPTADELYQIVKKRLPQISLGTVYRNLDLLSEAGKILKLQPGGKQKRFDGRVEKHFHMRCTGCDRVFDLDDSELEDIDRQLSDFVARTKLDDYNLELHGQCEDCRAELD